MPDPDWGRSRIVPDVDPTAQANEALLRTYRERIVNQGDWSAWPEVFAETLSFNGRDMTRDDIQAVLDTFRTILPDMRMTVELQMASGDRVATRVILTGTHQGDYMGLKASGKVVSLNGLALDRVQNGYRALGWT